MLINQDVVSLLPSYPRLNKLFFATGLPCHGAKIETKPIKFILEKIARQEWVEGLYVHANEINQIIRYKNHDGNHKNDFDEKQFLSWIKTVETTTALCDMENNNVGLGVFVLPGKIVPRGTFIPSSGIIKLDPTTEELATKINCSALQNLNSVEKKIIGFIDPEKRGGILNFINHAPDKQELPNFVFKKTTIKDHVATSNLTSIIKFYNGYAIMGLEAMDDISGGECGTQLLWSYARSCEYIENNSAKTSNKSILLFNKADKHNGETIDPSHYALRTITILIDTGELKLQQVAAMTRWELMEYAPNSGLFIKINDPHESQSKPMQSVIPYKLLQTHLAKNPQVDRIIIEASDLSEMRKNDSYI